MTDPVATPLKGTVLKVTVSSTLTTIGQIESIGQMFDVTQQAVETTGLDNTWKTFIGSILDAGEVNFVLNWNPSNSVHGNIWTEVQSGNVTAWSITCADAGAASLTFSGVMTKFQAQGGNAESIVKVNCTLKISGALTNTP